MTLKDSIQAERDRIKQQEQLLLERFAAEVSDPEIANLFQLKRRASEVPRLKDDAHGITLYLSYLSSGKWRFNQAWVAEPYGDIHQFADVCNFGDVESGQLKQVLEKAIAEVEIFKEKLREQRATLPWWRRLF